MEIKTIAMVAKMDDGTIRHVYTKESTRNMILSLINSLEGSISVSEKEVEDIEIGKPNE